MKAARKVGDAKKHECTFHHRSQETSSDLLHSKTRVLSLIRVIHLQHSHSQHHRLRTVVPCLPLYPKVYSKSTYESFPKARRKGINRRPTAERINQ